MKKRIISVFLAVIMIVLAAPALAVNAFDDDLIDDVRYNVYTSSQYIYVDGRIDKAYYGSSKIVSFGADSTWYAYSVATLDGFYVFAHVEDLTMNNALDQDASTGDGIAIYLDWTPYGYSHTDLVAGEDYINSFANQVGTVFADYEGNIAADKDFEYVAEKGSVSVNKLHNVEWDELDEKTQFIGYNIEVFIPYTDYMLTVVATQSDRYHFGLGIQVNDDLTYDGIDMADSCSYDTENGENYASGFELLSDVELKYAGEMPVGVGSDYAAHASSEIALDGKNTKGEYDDAQAVSIDKGGHGKANEKNIFRVICDGTYLGILVEMTDYTVNAGDIMALYFARYGEGDTLVDESIERTRGWLASGQTENGQISTVGNDIGWAVEIRIELSEREKAFYREGKLVYGISVVIQDDDANGHVSCKSDVAELADSFHAEAEADHIGLYRRFLASSDMGISPDLKGANVSLAEGITMKFYADLGRADLDAKLKITMENKIYYLGAQKTEKAGEYKFVFENIAPQYMGDSMNVELVVNGEAVDGVSDYSVLKNVTSGDVLNSQTEQLIYDLLAYGKAAQDFVGYKTDYPINEDYKDKSQAGQLPIYNEDRTYTDPLDDARFTAANIQHDNVNMLFIKFEALDIENTTVLIDGKPAVIEIFSEEEYSVSSEAIKVTDFDRVYTFTLITPTGEQTLTYSINAYTLAKCEAEHAETSNLANALYAYGVAAEAYVELLNSVSQ